MRRLLAVLLLLAVPAPAAADTSPQELRPAPVLYLLDAPLDAVDDVQLWVGDYLSSGLIPNVDPSRPELSARAAAEFRSALELLHRSMSAADAASSALERARATLALRRIDFAAAAAALSEAELRTAALVLALAAETSSVQEDARLPTVLSAQLRDALVAERAAADAVVSSRTRMEAGSSHVTVSRDTLESALEARSLAVSDFALMLQSLRAISGGFELPSALSAPSGCPLYAPASTIRSALLFDEGSDADDLVPVLELCERSAALASSSEAAAAVRYAFRMLGAPYACSGVGRSDLFRFDCSSFVSRAYWEGAGVPVASESWAPSTRDMVPWDGHELAEWLEPLPSGEARPGDLALFDTGLTFSRHVVMILADGLMVHTNSCGDVLHVTDSWLAELPSAVSFLGARRVLPDAASSGSFWQGSQLDDATGLFPPTGFSVP